MINNIRIGRKREKEKIESSESGRVNIAKKCLNARKTFKRLLVCVSQCAYKVIHFIFCIQVRKTTTLISFIFKGRQ